MSKICMISSYPPTKEGVGVFTKNLVNTLRNRGENVEVLTFSGPSMNDDVDVRRVLSSSPFAWLKVYSELKDIKPDIVHVQYATPVYRLYAFILWWNLWLTHRKSNSRLFVTYHEVKRETDLLRKPGIYYYRLLSKIFDKIFVHTDQAKNILVKQCKVQSGKITVIPLGVTVQKRPKIVATVKPTRVLYFGYIHPDKGIDVLINSLPHIRDSDPSLFSSINIRIAGSVRPRQGIFRLFGFHDDSYFKKIHNLVEELHLENSVAFTGYTADKDIDELFTGSRVIVLPYRNVEQSAVLNLALGMGRPIIASNIGGLAEVLGKAGILIEPDNPEALAKALIKVLRDDNLSKKTVKGYAEIVNNQSLDKAVSQYLLCYRSVGKC